MRTKTFFMIMALAVALMTTGWAQMGPGGSGHSHGPNVPGFMQDVLTDAQKQELHETVAEMRQAGATREKIRAAVDALFEEWGINRPHHGVDRFADVLSETQFAELEALVAELREQGASREEIHAAVEAKFEEWGIEMPEPPGLGGDGHRGRGGMWMHNLTEEQRQAIQEMVQQMRENGASREQIHEAVQAKFDEWGIEMPARGLKRFSDVLTEEQIAELEATVAELRENGATREEIHAAVQALFNEWGIEMPPPGGHGHKGKRHPGMGNLTPEQRQAIRELVQQLRQEGATREEIRKAVLEQLQEWGIKPGEKGSGMKKSETGKIKASNAPNPFNPSTTITYTLQQAGQVSVKVYNTQGRLVRTLVDSYGQTGSHTVMWDGLTDQGEQAASGMYFYTIATPDQTLTQRMTLLQ